MGILDPYIRESAIRVSKFVTLKRTHHGTYHYVEKSHPPWNSSDGVSKFKPHESVGLKIQTPMIPPSHKCEKSSPMAYMDFGTFIKPPS